jgi:hypothetical protein
VARMGEKRYVYRLLVGEPEGKKPLGRQRRRWMENIKVHVRFEVFTAVTMKKGVFWDVTPCGSCKIRRFGGTAVRCEDIPSISSQLTSVASCSLCYY